MKNEKLTFDALTEDCILNLSYYYLMGASLLLNKFDAIYKYYGLDKNNLAAYRTDKAMKKIKEAVDILDTFDDEFIRASDGSIAKFDAYQSVAYELIALNLAYIGHSYMDTNDSNDVFKLIFSQGSKSESLEKLSDYFLEKSIEVCQKK